MASNRVTSYLSTLILLFSLCGLECKTETSASVQLEAQVQDEKASESCLFKSDVFFSLSKIRQEIKHLPLDIRCQRFHDELQSNLNGADSSGPVTPLTKPELFQLSIQMLRRKQLLLNIHYGALAAIEECVAKLPDYQMKCSVRPATTSLLATLAEKLTELEDKLAESENKLAESDNKLAELESKLAERQNKLTESEHKFARIDRIATEVQKKLDRVQAVHFDQTVQIVHLKRELELSKSRLEEMALLYYQASDREAKTKRELEEARKSLIRLTGRYMP